MKLYYAPGACSLSVHIALREAKLPFTLDRVLNLQSTERKTESGEDFYSINPAGYVPVLKLDDGSIITEGGAILEYIADIAPKAHLAPESSPLERARMRSWLIFLATEILKSMWVFFIPNPPEDLKSTIISKLHNRFALVEKHLSDGRAFLLGKDFSVADCYAFVILGYGNKLRFDMSNYPKLNAYLARIAERPAVVEALKSEASGS